MKPYYDEDGIQVFCGDCREILPSLSIGAILADPPYGNGYEANGKMAKSRTYEPIFGNNEPFDPSWLLKLEVPTILWGANHYASRLPERPGWLVWRKRAFYVADVELAWTSFVSRPAFIEVEWRGATRGIEFGEHYHPTQKPLAVMRWCIEMLEPDALIADPFMGSGTTLRAAKDLGRKAIGIEIERAYCDIAIERLRQQTLPFDASPTVPESEGRRGLFSASDGDSTDDC